MLANVQLDREETTVLPAPPSLTATLNSMPTSFTNAFSLTDSNTGCSVANVVLIETASQEISITLEGAVFSFSGPLHWILPPAGGVQNPSLNGNVYTFTIRQPLHVLAPWAFRIAVDTPEASGIESQTIFLTKPAGFPECDQIQYDASDGSFILPGHDKEPVVPIFLINAGIPGSSATFSVDLILTSVPTGIEIAFAEKCLVFSSGIQPDWVTFSRSEQNTLNMTMTISSGGGQSIGFQFAIEITLNGTTTTVLSPDPILINATIGDG